MALPKIELPSFSTTIPSTGVVIRYVPYTVGQEKLLLTASESGDLSEIFLATRDMILKCYNGIDIDKLTSYDIDYLFLQLRIQSVSNISELYFRSMTCGKTGEECEKTLKLNINLSDIKVQKLNEDTDKYEDYVPIIYKNGGIPIEITDTVGVIMKHPGFAEQEAYSLLSDQTEDDLIKLCIVSVYDDETVYTRDDFSPEDLEDFYKSIRPNQLTEIKKFIRNAPKVRYEAQFKCKECGFTEPLLFEDFESFFG